MDILVSSRLPCKWGEYTISAFGEEGVEFPHVVMYRGLEKLRGVMPVPVRIHSECMTGDVFGSSRCDCGEQLSQSLFHFKENGGALIYLRQEGRGIGLVEKLRAYNRQDEGMDTYEANRAGGHGDDLRNYGDAVEVLKLLGVEDVLLLTNNPLKVKALEQFGLTVKRQGCKGTVTADNADYLRAKAEITGHFI